MEIDENLTKIASKTEEIMKKSSDQNVKSNMKLIADRVKSLVVVKEPVEAVLQSEGEKVEAVTNESLCAKDIQPNPSAVIKDNSDSTSVQNADDEIEEQSEVSRMLKENAENPVVEDELPGEMNFPEIKKPTKDVLEVGGTKRLLETSSKDQNVEKKLKYESPLDFLRVPKNKYELNKA